MRRLTLTLLLSAGVFLTGLAHANPVTPSVEQIMRIARADVVVPPEWDGIWTTVDSTYTCAGALQGTSTGSDTLCGGKDYSPDTTGLAITFTCSGTSDATTFDMTCTGSGDLITDCTATYTMVTHGTRNGDTYQIVSTMNVSYSGTACGFLPPSCTQFDSWGTRIGPAPSDYCATPTRTSTWGRLKSIYR